MGPLLRFITLVSGPPSPAVLDHWNRRIHSTKLAVTIFCLLTFGAFPGSAQTLTSTFQFTASGWIGTPATVSTPFRGSVFTNAAVTITEVAFTGNRGSCCSSGYYLINDSASIFIAGIGTFQVTTETYTFSNPNIDPLQGVTSVEIGFWTGVGTNYPTFPMVDFTYPQSSPWNLDSSFAQIQPFISTQPAFSVATSGGQFTLTTYGSSGSFQALVTPGVPCAANQSGATNIEDVKGIINEALGTSLPATDLNGDGAVTVTDIQDVTNAVLTCGITTSGTTPMGFSTRIPIYRKHL